MTFRSISQSLIAEKFLVIKMKPFTIDILLPQLIHVYFVGLTAILSVTLFHYFLISLLHLFQVHKDSYLFLQCS